MNPQSLEFLQTDYGLKIKYLSDHYSRMWNRCHFFVALQTALGVALLGWFKDKGIFSRDALLIAVIGAVTSFCWYIFGAQDRYLAELYRIQVKLVAEKLFSELDLPRLFVRQGKNPIPYTHVGDTENVKLPMSLYQWRVGLFSTTKLVAWLPLVIFLLWMAMIVILLA